MHQLRALALIKILIINTLCFAGFGFVDTTGTLRGVVKDPTGAVLGDVRVEVRNISTNDIRSVQTSEEGEFSFAALPIGNYSIIVDAPGFQKFEQTLKLNLNQTLQLFIELSIATQDEVIQVEASAEQARVETASTQLGDIMEANTINTLPLNGRNVFKTLLQLQPGVMSSTGSSIFVGDDKNLTVNGNRGRANNYTINGGDANDFFANTPSVEPTPDAIEEFRVITNTFDAEYGRNSGSIINLVTKSGTNEFHGSLFEYFMNNKLNARGFFDPPERPQFNSNIFGATFGGPIVKDKQFFFASYQGTRLRRGITTGPVRVFTDAERLGLFAPGELGDEFPDGNIAGSIDPLAVKLLNFVPRANVGDRTFIAAPIRSSRADQFTLRYDAQLSANHRFTAYYYLDDSTTFEPISTFQNITQTTILPGFGDNTEQRSQNVNLSETWIISPTTINELRFNYVRLGQGIFHEPVNRVDVTGFGFNGITPGLPGRTGIPYINVAGQFIIGNNFLADLPQFGNTYQVSDSLTKQTGDHTVKFGVDFRRIQFNQLFFFAVSGFYGFGASSSDSTGNLLGDFLLGRPDFYLQGSPGQLALRAFSINLFAQDSWRVRPNLTFNYGLRWQFDPPAYDLRNRIQAFREGQQSKVFPTAPRGFVFPGDEGVPRGLAQTYYRAFAPRIGLAYSPSASSGLLGKIVGAGKTSIRAAFGIAYNPVEQLVLEQFTGQPPFGGSTSTFESTLANPFLLRDGTRLPNPFPVRLPKPGDPVDFSQFAPAVIFGQINPTLRPQYAVQYNLNIQRQLGKDWIFSIAYVGSQGHRLLATYDLNPGIPSLCQGLPGCGPYGEDSAYPGFAGTRKFNSVNFDGNPFFSSIFTQDSIANSNYHSMQLNFTQNKVRGIAYSVAYTLSKSIDNASAFEQVINPFDYDVSRSLSQFDARHRLTFYYDIDLPVAQLLRGAPARLVNGWQLSGITTFQSGFPIRLQDFTDASLTGITAGFETADTPDQVAPVRILDPRKNNLLYFDPASFASVPEHEYGRFGTAGRQFFSGPGISNFDLSLIKSTNLTESKRLEVRCEVFNLFNRTNFLNPDGIITDGDRFGKVFRSRDPRLLQLVVKLAF